MARTDIKLGMTLRDPASGLTGITTNKTSYLSGMVQYSIQPKGDGNNVPEGYLFDENILEIVDEGISSKAAPADPTVTIQIGEKVQDVVTGFKGIAVDKVTYLNGCVYFNIVSKVSRLVGEESKMYLEHKRLKRIGEGVSSTVKKPEPNVKTTGGPMAPMRRL